MSLEKQIILISAAHLSCFLSRLPEWFVSLFLVNWVAGLSSVCKIFCVISQKLVLPELLAAFTRGMNTSLTCSFQISSLILYFSLSMSIVYLSLQQSHSTQAWSGVS